MSWGQYLFGFRGRLNRSRYWAFIFLYMIALIVLTAAIVAPILILAATGYRDPGFIGILVFLLMMLFILLLFVASLAVSVKRLHDRNRSGWWVIPFYFLPTFVMAYADFRMRTAGGLSTADALVVLLAVPLTLWGFVELAVLGGTKGENRYGADPVSRPAETAATFS